MYISLASRASVSLDFTEWFNIRSFRSSDVNQFPADLKICRLILVIDKNHKLVKYDQQFFGLDKKDMNPNKHLGLLVSKQKKERRDLWQYSKLTNE